MRFQAFFVPWNQENPLCHVMTEYAPKSRHKIVTAISGSSGVLSRARDETPCVFPGARIPVAGWLTPAENAPPYGYKRPEVPVTPSPRQPRKRFLRDPAKPERPPVIRPGFDPASGRRPAKLDSRVRTGLIVSIKQQCGYAEINLQSFDR